MASPKQPHGAGIPAAKVGIGIAGLALLGALVLGAGVAVYAWIGS